MAEDKASGEVSASGGTSKVVLIASLVNMVATIGIVGVLLVSHQKEKSAPTVDDIVKGQAKGGGGHGDASAEHGGGGEHGGEHGGGHGGGGEHGGSSSSGGASDAGKMLALEPFTVNLTTGAGTSPRYVRMNVSLELEQGVPEKEFDVKQPRVRDTIINLLNSKKATELNAVEGREQLKDDIKRSINAFMLQSKVKGVYFTNFAISN
ncbi:MAG: flagellar basal body-associated FliL family protein [Deltaproteobacteria bacterium]|nr:flagellar basal body-associated FliL family protein [Deltaproteobacteria bacterium]